MCCCWGYIGGHGACVVDCEPSLRSIGAAASVWYQIVNQIQVTAAELRSHIHPAKLQRVCEPKKATLVTTRERPTQALPACLSMNESPPSSHHPYPYSCTRPSSHKYAVRACGRHTHRPSDRAPQTDMHAYIPYLLALAAQVPANPSNAGRTMVPPKAKLTTSQYRVLRYLLFADCATVPSVSEPSASLAKSRSAPSKPSPRSKRSHARVVRLT